jgi:transcriptional regulator with XRE-family HTH domain
MSQRELADLLGVTERSIQAYEQGETIPYRYGAKLESALGRPVAWFWYGEQALSSRDEQFEELKREIGALRAEVRKLTRELGRFTKPA